MKTEAMTEELLDLLTERALDGLSPADELRLGRLLEAAGLTDEDGIDLAAAAAMNAFACTEKAEIDAVPASLTEALRADAGRHFASAPAKANVRSLEQARTRRAQASGETPTRSWTAGIGWAVAAMLAVVVVISLQPEPITEGVDPAAARASLLAEAGSTVVEWSRSEIPAYNRVTGDVVWNDERQEGYLRLAGMPMNDPAIAQYQLWIVDPDRDANPVDGGVFDIPSGADEIIIPIDAKLDVADPAAFAITREQPGGVVVSDGPLLIVAST